MNKIIINEKLYEDIKYELVPGAIILSNNIDDLQISIILDYGKEDI